MFNRLRALYYIFYNYLDRVFKRIYNAVMKRLGNIQTQFFAYIQMMGITKVKIGDMRTALRLTADQEYKLLSRLCKASMITRVQRGIYLVPEKLPPGGKWTASEPSALKAIMQEHNGRYQVCGPNTFNYYGYDEQIPLRVFVYNNRISGTRKIGATTFEFIRTKRLGGTERIKMRDGTATIYASRVRALVDAVYDWSRFNTLPRAYKWIRDDIRAGTISPEALIKNVLLYGDVGTIRRIGVLLESENIPENLLQTLEKSLRPSSAYIPFMPGKPKRGRISKRWGVVINGRD